MWLAQEHHEREMTTDALAKAKELIVRGRMLMANSADPFRERRNNEGYDLLTEAIKTLETPQPSALKDEQETRARIIDILDECERTVYAQQKWKVAHAGLQGWLFKIDAEAQKEKTP